MKSKFLYTIALVCVVLLIGRLALPHIVKYSINRILETKIENYQGYVTDVDIGFIDGSYTLKDLTIKKSKGQQDPLLFIKTTKIAVSWPALWQGVVVARVFVDQADVKIIDSKNEGQQQYGSEEDPESWKEALDKIIPVKVDFMELKNSSVRFKNSDVQSVNEFAMTNIRGRVSDLIMFKGEDQLLSPVNLEGSLEENGKVSFKGGVNITKDPMLFDLDFSLQGFDIRTVNELMRLYVPIDVNSGKLTLIGEGIGDEDKLKGYLKIFFDDLDIFSIDQKFVSGEHFLIEALSGFANWVLEVVTGGDVATELSYVSERGRFEFSWDESLWNSLENVGNKIDREFKGMSLKKKSDQ